MNRTKLGVQLVNYLVAVVAVFSGVSLASARYSTANRHEEIRVHASATPETAREMRKRRAEARLERNRANLERLAREKELPPVDEVLLAEYKRIITYLADPEREGRAPGTRGIVEAAEYVRDEFESLGLVAPFAHTTPSEDGELIETGSKSYFQSMPIGTALAAEVQEMSIGNQPLVAGEDFQPLAYSGSESVSGDVVFTGYAIVSGPNGYMGFESSTKLDGKIALCLKYEPMDASGSSLWDAEDWSHHSRLTYKISALERRGAGAVLIVSPESADDDTAGMMDSIGSTSPPPSMGLKNGGPKFDIPVLSISPQTAERIIASGRSGQTLDGLISRANRSGVVEEIKGARVSVDVQISKTKTYTDNIGAVLPGQGDLADEYIVIGAHYDHVGYGHFGSRARAKDIIHPGADDNASGTAGVVLAAQQLSQRYALLSQTDQARSVLFLLFTAEESGLNGSRYYVDHPIVDIDNHEIMLNMDMIGRLEADPLEVGGLDSSDELRSLVLRELDESGMIYDQDTSVGPGRSDHANFEAKKVPNVFFFTGLHDDYHTPNDTLDRVDLEGALRISSVVSEIAFDAATTHDDFIHERERRVEDARKDDNQQPRVRIGIIPVDAADGGLFVQRVFNNTSASDAGLQSGDRITHWDGEEITSVESWSPVLVEHEPGDVVELTVERDGEVLDIQMTLKGLK
ncbi:MAG: M20/M25/M40 family metallo-hydrolase [Phycisphaerales bacterium]|nr:M20/M25/M40 family metallo-hydrolase [Phycisphaerales bacterium]